MTVAELIEELQKYPPYRRVHVLLSEVYGVMREKDGSIAINDERAMSLNIDDSAEAHTVTNEGSFVLIESK